MNDIALKTASPGTGLRWLGFLLLDAADRLEATVSHAAHALERVFDRDPIDTSHELYFDSDAYLAEIKNRVHGRYY